MKDDKEFIEALEKECKRLEPIKVKTAKQMLEKVDKEGVYLKIDGVKYYHEGFVRKLLNI